MISNLASRLDYHTEKLGGVISNIPGINRNPTLREVVKTDLGNLYKSVATGTAFAPSNAQDPRLRDLYMGFQDARRDIGSALSQAPRQYQAAMTDAVRKQVGRFAWSAMQSIDQMARQGPTQTVIGDRLVTKHADGTVECDPITASAFWPSAHQEQCPRVSAASEAEVGPVLLVSEDQLSELASSFAPRDRQWGIPSTGPQSRARNFRKKVNAAGFLTIYPDERLFRPRADQQQSTLGGRVFFRQQPDAWSQSDQAITITVSILKKAFEQLILSQVSQLASQIEVPRSTFTSQFPSHPCMRSGNPLSRFAPSMHTQRSLLSA